MKSVQPELWKEESRFYRIEVEGRLDESWSNWLEGMEIAIERRSDGVEVTTMMGALADQAALHGVLNRIRDLNLKLISVQLIRCRS